MNNNGNQIVIVDNYDKFLVNWPFLLEGFKKVLSVNEDNLPDVTPEQYFKTLLTLATQSEIGRILILKNSDERCLGLLVLVDVTCMFQQKTLNVYIAYTNNTCPSTMIELWDESLRWARKNKFVKMQALSYRVKPRSKICGAVRRHFGNKFGMFERAVIFERDL